MGELIQFPVRRIQNFDYIIVWSWPGEESYTTNYDNLPDAEQFVAESLGGKLVASNTGGMHYDTEFNGAATIKKVVLNENVS